MGSSIITVAETLPRGATSLLSVSFSPPKLLILKSACKPCPHLPLFPPGPAQPAAAGLPSLQLARCRAAPAGLIFPQVLLGELKGRPRFLSAEPRDVVGETCGAQPSLRSALSSPQRRVAVVPGETTGAFSGLHGVFFPSTGIRGIVGLVAPHRPPRRRRRQTLTPFGKPGESLER